jgi:hypothetical protein
VEALLKDDRYRSATEKLIGPAGADATSNADPRPYEEKFLEAVRYLVGEGIPQTKAEANLAKIANVVEASHQQQIDQLLAVAAQLDQEGEWDKSMELYRSLIDHLPQGDDRAKYAEQCIATIEENQAMAQV